MTDLGILVPDIDWIKTGTKPITHGSEPDMYLRSRGLEIKRFPRDLRMDRAGNILAIIRDHVYGIGVSYQRVFLPLKERKMAADVKIPHGSAVRLGPVSRVMGIAEGTETALSAYYLYGVSTWAALSASYLQRWQPPVEVERLCIFADNDKNGVGQKAARKLGERALARGISVSIRTPPMCGDWNDCLKELKCNHKPSLAIGGYDGMTL